MTILLAGLQVIPRDYFEAADVFGATTLKRTLFVVLPLLRPSLQNALIIRTIFAFQTFAVVFALAGRVIPVLAGESYNWYVANRNPNIAAAYAVTLPVDLIRQDTLSTEQHRQVPVGVHYRPLPNLLTAEHRRAAVL